uniref:T9SS type A sorting domain-containing protein n=1 Tax=uncultured Algibacter sp. TaxID=298659 RepID=UPI002635C883
GYAQVNKTGSIRAYQFVSFYGANNGSHDGTKVPTRYLPVGQGFIAEIENDGVLPFDGTVKFNNSQRVFIKESDADPSNDQVGSVFSKTAKGKTTKGTNASKTTEETPMQRIRLEFNSVTGPKTRHELLLGFSEYTTDGYDYGYDAENPEASNNDLNLSLEGKNMCIQAYGQITDSKAVPLNFSSSGDNTFEIRITETENIDSEQPIYLRDNQTGTYFNLRQDLAYGFTSVQGIFNERFEIVFHSEQQSLSTQASAISDNNVYFQNTTNTLFAKKLSDDVTKLSLINMRGQSVLELTNVSKERLEGGIQFNTVSTGTYVVCMRTSLNKLLTKKIIINKK